ncbi:norsolorinic acid reductase [Lentinus tigrinus ALCF2SS1-7]|uniref:Norsolorinic acid reductase n=1 Tax=Lentinus tigrinus ALCF2SS1-6 TaxID=1328759 RepID=A0A5C2RVM8_9APHY|nr:norsolorinic acid reductase [Lentinus tigrinus ALCF2SS1-6]RPD69158.1 norsolorinic acid reductase [Lentinus tigrinus ALCF2SS1-7]
MSAVTPQPQPARELGRYRLLSPSAGVRVSPMCLGTMSLGQAWRESMAGAGTTKEEAFEFLDTYYNNGGNFLDTSTNYNEGESEEILGEWMAARRNRDQMVIATKYTIGIKNVDPEVKIKANYQGNHRKSLLLTVQQSLAQLKTTYLDILYLHLWDYSTSIPEVMQALDSLVKANKVLYLGISDTPAWIVTKANDYAREHGMAQFVLYQGAWNLKERDLEREILPMCRAEGMGIVPWGLLGQGKFKTAAEIKGRTAIRYGTPQTEEEKKVSLALEKVAREVGQGATLASVAVAWALLKAPYVFPMVGGRSPAQLEEAMKGLEIVLTPEQIKALEDAVPFSLGFPYNYFATDPAAADGRPNYFVLAAGHTKYVKSSTPIAPGP